VIVLGLMSGTSMDGLDCCLSDVNISNNNQLNFKIIDYSTIEYKKNIKMKIVECISNKNRDLNSLDLLLGELFFNLSKKFLNHRQVDLIASHGQTISHRDREYSIQIGHPKYLSRYYNVPIIYNFRKNDIDAGGSGAPLVPYLDWLLFRKSNQNVVAINLGGISNFSFIKKDCSKNNVIGFDMGPGMCLIDLYVRKNWKIDFDNNGELSSKGIKSNELLKDLMLNSFIQKIPPKSATVEDYGMEFLTKYIEKYNEINKYDFLRTLVNFTSELIQKNLNNFIGKVDLKDANIIVGGGGAKNLILINDLKKSLNTNIQSIHYNGINIDNKESFLMCVLGCTTYNNIPNNMPSVTGADREVICGELYE